jgi:hypothetical protein
MAGIALASAVLPGFCPSLAWAEDGPGVERSLDAVEINVFGQKYSHLPVPKRLERLEQQLDTRPAAPHPTERYRASRLLEAQQAALPSEERQAAVRAYNRAVDEAAKGNADAAMRDCREAIKLNPYLIPAYNNLAHLQEKARLYDEAAVTYRQVLAIAPDEPLLHFNLAVVLERIGKIPESFEAYRQYVTLSDKPDPQVVALLASYDAKRRKGGAEQDYVALASRDSHGVRLVWPDWQVPIPVYLTLSNAEQTAFLDCVHQGFDRWTQATNRRLRFREVGAPDRARLFITLQPGPLMSPDASIGHASFDRLVLESGEDPMRELKVSIVVNTGELQGDLPLSHRQEQVSRLLLHELGHAVGIWGHSNDPGDIMYTHPIVSDLSARDLKTIRRLYGLNAL